MSQAEERATGVSLANDLARGIVQVSDYAAGCQKLGQHAGVVIVVALDLSNGAGLRESCFPVVVQLAPLLIKSLCLPQIHRALTYLLLLDFLLSSHLHARFQVLLRLTGTQRACITEVHVCHRNPAPLPKPSLIAGLAFAKRSPFLGLSPPFHPLPSSFLSLTRPCTPANGKVAPHVNSSIERCLQIYSAIFTDI